MKQILFLAFALSLSINSSAEVYRRTTTVNEKIQRTTEIQVVEEVLGYSGRGEPRFPECHMELINRDGNEYYALYVDDIKVSVSEFAGRYAKYSGQQGGGILDVMKVMKDLVDRGDCKVYQKCEFIDLGEEQVGMWGINLGRATVSLGFWRISGGPTKSLNEMRLKGYCQ